MGSVSNIDPSLAFPDLPPFPTGESTAPLLRLSLQKLLTSDLDELQRLWSACTDVGFFYLDLRDAESTEMNGNTFLKEAYELFGVASKFFDLPVDDKAKYNFRDQGTYFGYKGFGANIVDAKGNRDRNEFYNVSKDDILGISKPWPAPPILTPHRPLFESYIRHSHAIVTLLLGHLNSLLGLPASTLSSLHALSAVSGDQVRFVRAPPQPSSDRQTALGAHTDFGSVTLLFNRLGGLQILPPETDGLPDDEKHKHWLWVRPLRGHCIVNLGDAMVKFTRGVLRSNIHRVVNPPGEQAGETRLSLVYFSRPADDVVLRPVQGSKVIEDRKVKGEEMEEISSREWILRRALGQKTVEEWEKSRGTEGARVRTVAV